MQSPMPIKSTMHKVGDLVLVDYRWPDRKSEPCKIHKIFSGNQALVKNQKGRVYKVTTGQCSEAMTETEFFKQILLNGG